MDATDHSDLIGVDLETAIELKYQRGREKYGNEEWIGPEPIVAAHDELLDAAVYIGLERMVEPNGKRAIALDELMTRILDAVRGVRLLATDPQSRIR